MQLTEELRQEFYLFLGEQGITIELSISLKPKYKSIEDYLFSFEGRYLPISDIFLFGFDWKKSVYGSRFWQYHHICWNKLLKELESL